MGCDIHIYAEKKVGTDFEPVEVPSGMDGRSYRVFAFLAGVRNYSAINPISEPRGFPGDASKEVSEEYKLWGWDAHTPSWLTIDELTSFDYCKIMEDRRCMSMKNGILDGGCTCDPRCSEVMTYKEYLGKWFIDAIDELKNSGVYRIVFWFDN